MLIDLQSLWEKNTRLNKAHGSTANSYSLVGAASKNQYEFSIPIGVYTVTGTLVGVYAGRTLGIASGAYVLTGSTTGLRATRLVQVANGNYTLSGTTVNIPAGHLASVTSGSYIVTGADVTLTFAGQQANNIHLLAIMGMGG